MPVCNKCGETFPNRITVDGQLKKLRHRKYCLSCSPFGTHNTKKIHDRNITIPTRTDRVSTGDECICQTCGRKYIFRKSSGHTTSKCNSCVVNIRRLKLKTDMINYKGGKCVICGYSKCHRSLGFHHIDPKTKLFDISGNHSKSWESIKKELDKCILVCNNCHGEIEDGLLDLQAMQL